jgi:hypothetical protein
MAVSYKTISNALLTSTRDGTYPESEEVLTKDVESSALQSSLQLVEEAKHQIEVGFSPLGPTKLSLTSTATDRYP